MLVWKLSPCMHSLITQFVSQTTVQRTAVKILTIFVFIYIYIPKLFEQREEKLPDRIGTPGVAYLRTFSEGIVASCMPEKDTRQWIDKYLYAVLYGYKKKKKKKKVPTRNLLFENSQE